MSDLDTHPHSDELADGPARRITGDDVGVAVLFILGSAALVFVLWFVSVMVILSTSDW